MKPSYERKNTFLKQCCVVTKLYKVFYMESDVSEWNTSKQCYIVRQFSVTE